MSEPRKIEIVLERQNYIEAPPIAPKQLYGSACSSDSITIDSWRDTWVRNLRANHKNLGGFASRSIGKLFGANQNKPAFIVGSGPSLGYNGHALKDRAGIFALSCLHNYHFFEDRGIDIDLYVTLDAGPVVLEEVSEGGKKTPEEYWASTKNKKLAAFVGSDPELFKKWQGEIYLFTAPIPDAGWNEAMAELESFHCVVSNGGNVLGAALYIAKAFLGSNPIAFVGADFSFSQNTGKGHKFHSWDSKYDAKVGNVQRAVDIFGNKSLTWPSYYNFKGWFEYVALQTPGIFVNCTEGGILGAYPEGNLMAIRQMGLQEFVDMYEMNRIYEAVCKDPSIQERRLLF